MLQHPGVVSEATLNPTLSLVSEWLRLLPFLGVLALLGYLAVRPFLPKKKQQKDSLINLKIQKENPKVVNEINIEDLCLTKAYCRCWRSKTVRHCATVGSEIETCIFLAVLWWCIAVFSCCLCLELERAPELCRIAQTCLHEESNCRNLKEAQ